MLRQEIAVLTETVLTQGQGLHANESLDSLEALTRELQDCVMAIRMQPVKSVFLRMPRLVREVAGKLNKHVRLVMIGEHTELDKTVIEELADPLTHMIRNSVDHGLESTEKRIELGKNPEGEIKLTAAHVGSNILIHIEDDGAGINRERVYNKAIEKGIIAAGAKLTDDEICELIFAPGFSTAAAVTDVSGRGVGMDVVRRNIMKIGGRIHISSVEGKGSRFTLVIPLTLAVLDGMLLAVGKERYILPLTSIIESFVPTGDQLRPLVGGGTLVAVRGDYYRLVRLNTIFGVSHSQSDPTKALIVLVETASGGRIGLLVDELIGQQQVVIKSLKENYIPVPGLSGATILGDGRVALILDIEQLGKLSDQHLKGLDPVEIPELSVPQIHAA
jgi:two-component system chemotaxis sensor kinase CheA